MDALELQKRTRRTVLALLYNKRYLHPDQPGLLIPEIEGLLTCPRPRLDFNLWYLKESGFIDRTEAGRYLITARGVDFTEASAEVLLAETSAMTATVSPTLSAYKGRRN